VTEETYMLSVQHKVRKFTEYTVNLTKYSTKIKTDRENSEKSA